MFCDIFARFEHNLKKKGFFDEQEKYFFVTFYAKIYITMLYALHFMASLLINKATTIKFPFSCNNNKTEKKEEATSDESAENDKWARKEGGACT